MRQNDLVPHRFPFRLVDGIEADATGERATVSLTANGFLARGEPWPVTLVAEALAQAIAALKGGGGGVQARLVALHGVQLRQTVFAGDRLRVEVREEARLGNRRRFVCRAWRAGALVAEGTISVTG